MGFSNKMEKGFDSLGCAGTFATFAKTVGFLVRLIVVSIVYIWFEF